MVGRAHQEAAVDALVVGAGPSGAVVAHELATRGFSVVVLEQGDWVNPSELPANHPEWELLCQRRWHHDPNVRRLASDYPLDVSDSDMEPVMFNAVGGSSIFYGAEWPRLLPSDFRVRSLDGVCDDWPISYDDLKPFHDEVDAFIGVAGLSGDTAYPPGLEYPLTPNPIGKIGRRAAAECNALGWHWWPGTNAIAPHPHKTLEGCGRVGTCEWGCPSGAKASFDLIYLPQALKAGARLVTSARVRELPTDASGRVTGAIYVDADGVERHQPASVTVLCANGIGTSRLLLLSGLANSSDLVGRNLMLHPNCTVTGYYDDDLESWHGPAGQLVHSLEFYDTRPEHDFVRGCKMHVLPTPGPLNALEVRRADAFDDVFGSAFHDVVRTHGRGILWAANTEDLPDPENRVTLSPDQVDGDGIPAPKVSYRISENTRRILRFTVERMTELHLAGGAVETYPVEIWTDQPGHLLGTARMGTDPRTSVTDPFGRCHDVPNLFIADGSLMVTSGAANPTCTITALALRVARTLADRASLVEVPT